jgi:hypothetical protein
MPGLFLPRSRPWLWATAAEGGLEPAPVSRFRGAYPHRISSYALLGLTAVHAHGARSSATRPLRLGEGWPNLTLPGLQSVLYSGRVIELASLGTDWLAPKPLGSDRQLDPARFNVPNSYTGCRKRIALLDQVARLPQPRGQE